MRKVFRYLRAYQSKHFDARLYVIITAFLSICFVFNYTLDFEDSYIDQLKGTNWYWIAMLVWMAFPYVTVSIIIRKFNQKEVRLNSQYWLMVLVGFGILALDRTYTGYQIWIKELSTSAVDRYFITKCVNWSSSLILNVLPLMLVYRFLVDEYPRNFFGLAQNKFDAKPYFQMLGIAVVLIGIGSFFSDLQSYYPRFQFSRYDRFAEIHELPEWVTVLLYEVSYALDFISVEVFFRGFLIFAFSRTLGGYAVLAMISSYAFLHFGKPMTEAISSVFGGFILGVVAYRTRSVWGGIIIHVGVAWAMEVFGHLQKVF